MRRLKLSAMVVSLSLAAIQQTLAMQFRAAPPADDFILVRGEGEIIPGDFDRLRDVILSQPRGYGFGLSLDSPGGNLAEAEKLAEFIMRAKLPVGVDQDARCVSACFLLFAASPLKLVAPDALIGVHSASQADGQESELSLAITTAMARDAASLGVPEAIVGKIVDTPPGGVNWLTHDDLASMGAKFITAETPPAQAPAAPAPPMAMAPAPSSAPPTGTGGGMGAPVAGSPAFQDGLAQRREWEAWFISLSGDYRDGASSGRRIGVIANRPDVMLRLMNPRSGLSVVSQLSSGFRIRMRGALRSLISVRGGTVTETLVWLCSRGIACIPQGEATQGRLTLPPARLSSDRRPRRPSGSFAVTPAIGAATPPVRMSAPQPRANHEALRRIARAAGSPACGGSAFPSTCSRRTL